MDIAAKYWEYVRSVIVETGEKSYKPFPAFEAGVMSERERIIALLEGQDYAEGKAAHNQNPSGVCRVCRAIALIKGEKA